MIPVLALVLFAAWFVNAFVVRSLIQRSRTGDSGLRPGGLRSRVGSVEWLAAWLFVVAVVAAVLAPAAELAGLQPWIANPDVRIGGMAVAVVGMALTFIAQLNMGDEWRIGVDTDESTRLVTNAAFRVVRNPIFSTMIITSVGLTVMVCNPVSLVGLASIVVAIELQVRCVEEPYLLAAHPTSYRRYAAHVGRFIPLVGRLHADAAAR